MEKTEGKLEIITRYFTDFSPVQLEQFAALEGLYREWNEKINVISRRDIDSLYEKHVLHSLSIAACFSFQKGQEVIDIGTGGGFPGIPLAIFFPETRFLLVDSIGKKIKVVEAVASAIGLKNVQARHGRAEGIRQQQFDVAVSRAVAPLKELWTWAKPLLRKTKDDSGQFTVDRSSKSSENIPNGLICLKGGDLAMEISESRCKPYMLEIHEIFPEPYFLQKYLLFVRR
ncbi:MAG TPA: 16S rRNA (guanine(527)-N(7))-methyltransferase RsmG [Puia sp.]|nr:16S rRNA (guanine(527)-N(7))-methyltransferase RsmG [Puia sp.]